MSEVDPQKDIIMPESELSEMDIIESEEESGPKELISDTNLLSILDAALFASEKPLSIYALKAVFTGTDVTTDRIKLALQNIGQELVNSPRGFELDSAGGHFQYKTKPEHLKFLRRAVKPRQLRLSPPAMEVLALLAYKQPLTKAEVDATRGVESGHLLRILMERGLVAFGGKSDQLGKPMLYTTTRKFLEIFSLRNLNELPSLNQIQELIPEGIEPDSGETLSDIAERLDEKSESTSYSSFDEEAQMIQDQLSHIETSTQFLKDQEAEKKSKLNSEKADKLRQKLAMGEVISQQEEKWLIKFDRALSSDLQLSSDLNLNENL